MTPNETSERALREAEDSERAERERQMELARRFMQEDRDVLSKLAEGSDAAYS